MNSPKSLEKATKAPVKAEGDLEDERGSILRIVREPDAMKTIALQNELHFRKMDAVLHLEKNCRTRQVGPIYRTQADKLVQTDREDGLPKAKQAGNTALKGNGSFLKLHKM